MVNRIQMVETRDKIRELTQEAEALNRDASSQVTQPEPGKQARQDSIRRITNLKADLEAAQQQVARIKAELAQARHAHVQLRQDSQTACSAANGDPDSPRAKLSQIKQDLAELKKTRRDQVEQSLRDGESASDVAWFSGLSVPMVYKIRQAIGIRGR